MRHGRLASRAKSQFHNFIWSSDGQQQRGPDVDTHRSGPPFSSFICRDVYCDERGSCCCIFFFYFFFFPTFTTAFTLSTLSTRWTRPELCRITRIGHGREPGETRPSRGAACLHIHTHSKWNLFLPWRHVNLSRLLAASWEIKVERGCSSILIGGKLCISLHSCHALIVCYGTLGASIPTAASRFLFSFFVRNFVVVALLALSSDQFTIIAAGRMYKFTGPEFPSPWNPRYIYISQEKCNQSIISFLAVICWARPHSTATRLWAATWRKKKKIFF